MIDQNHRVAFAVVQQGSDRIAALEIEPPHHLAHAAVELLEGQLNFVHLEEIVEDPLFRPLDDNAFRHLVRSSETCAPE